MEKTEINKVVKNNDYEQNIKFINLINLTKANQASKENKIKKIKDFYQIIFLNLKKYNKKNLEIRRYNMLLMMFILK